MLRQPGVAYILQSQSEPIPPSDRQRPTPPPPTETHPVVYPLWRILLGPPTRTHWCISPCGIQTLGLYYTVAQCWLLAHYSKSKPVYIPRAFALVQGSLQYMRMQGEGEGVEGSLSKGNLQFVRTGGRGRGKGRSLSRGFVQYMRMVGMGRWQLVQRWVGRGQFSLFRGVQYTRDGEGGGGKMVACPGSLQYVGGGRRQQGVACPVEFTVHEDGVGSYLSLKLSKNCHFHKYLLRNQSEDKVTCYFKTKQKVPFSLTPPEICVGHFIKSVQVIIMKFILELIVFLDNLHLSDSSVYSYCLRVHSHTV